MFVPGGNGTNGGNGSGRNGRNGSNVADPFGGIPKELRPDMAHLLMAAAIHAQQQQSNQDFPDIG